MGGPLSYRPSRGQEADVRGVVVFSVGVSVRGYFTETPGGRSNLKGYSGGGEKKNSRNETTFLG